MAQELFRWAELPAQERFAFASPFQPKYVQGIEPMIPLEHPDNGFFLFHVFSGKNKGCRFSGGKETAVRQSFPTAVLPVEVLVLHEEDVKPLRTGMRHQGQHDNHPLAECDFLPPGHAFQPAVGRRCDFLNGGVITSLLEIELNGRGQNPSEPTDMRCHHRHSL